MNSMSRGVVALALCAFALGGCATSSTDLKTPTDAFATAAGAAQTALQSYDNTIDSGILQTNTALALSGKGTVKAAEGDCGAKSTRCRIVLTGVGDKARPLDAQPSDPVTRQIMAGVVTYAANLQTIVAIDTQAGIQSATTTTLANINGLATAVDPSLATKLAPFTAPINDATTMILGAYLDSQKLAALRTATSAMEIVLPTAEMTWEARAVRVADQMQVDLATAFNKAQSAYALDPKSAQKLAALQTAATAYDTFLSTDPKSAFTALVTAHKTLAQALQPASGGKPDFAQALLDIQRAIDTAKKVTAIVQEFQAAAHPAASPATP